MFAIYSPPVLSKKKVRAGRTKSTRPEVKCKVTSLNIFTGAPLKPDSTRRKFSTVCGIVARERVPINLASWNQVIKNARTKIKKDILEHFDFADKSTKAMKRVERMAILIAGKAWKAWKSKLVTEFVHGNISPFDLYP